MRRALWGASATVMWTGKALSLDPSVSFPTVTPTVTGDSLDFGPGSVVRAILLEVPLFNAGEVSASGGATIAVTVNVTRLTSDFDPLFMIYDGLRYAMGNPFDNESGGAAILIGGDVLSDRWLMDGATGGDVFYHAGYPGVGEAFDVTLNFILTPLSSTVEISVDLH